MFFLYVYNYIYMYCCMYLCSCNFSTVIAGDDECVKFWPESTKKLYALAWGHPYMTTCLVLDFLNFFVISDLPCHIFFKHWSSIFHEFFPPTLNSNVIYGWSLWQKEEREQRSSCSQTPRDNLEQRADREDCRVDKKNTRGTTWKKEKKIKREPYLQDRRKWGQGGRFPLLDFFMSI